MLISVILKDGVQAALDAVLALPQSFLITVIAVIAVAVPLAIFRGKEGRG